MANSGDRRVALFKLVIVAFLWGGTFIAGRIAAGYLPPLTNAAIRFLLAGAGIVVLLTMSHSWRSVRLLDLVLLTLMGLSGVVAYNLLFFGGLHLISANRAALIVATNPAITMLAARFVLGEPLGTRRILGIVISLVGAAVVVTGGHGISLALGGRGDLMLFGCVGSWVCYTLLARQVLRRVPSMTASSYSTLIGMTILVVLAVPDVSFGRLLSVPAQAWAALAFLGIFGTTIGFKWYIDGVSMLGAGRAAQFINLVPVFAVVQAMVVLGEKPSAASLLGGALVIMGLTITQFSGEKR